MILINRKKMRPKLKVDGLKDLANKLAIARLYPIKINVPLMRYIAKTKKSRIGNLVRIECRAVVLMHHITHPFL